MDSSLSGSSVHGIFQAIVLEWTAISFSRGVFPTQGWNPGLPHCRQTLYHLSHQGSPVVGPGGQEGFLNTAFGLSVEKQVGSMGRDGGRTQVGEWSVG